MLTPENYGPAIATNGERVAPRPLAEGGGQSLEGGGVGGRGKPVYQALRRLQ